MKDVRPQFTDEEYNSLKTDATRLQVSLRKLVHDRALQGHNSDSPLSMAQCLSAEISKNREVLNQIITRETTTEIRLYEDDMIRLEKSMADLEQVVAKHISHVLRKELPNHGQPAL